MPKIIKIDWFFTELFIKNRWSLFARHREGVTALTKMVLTMRERCISAPMNVPAQPITVCCSIYTNNSHTHTASRVISSGDTRPTTDHNPNPIYPKLTLTDRGEGILQTGDVASWKECRQYASEFCQTCRQLTPNVRLYQQPTQWRWSTTLLLPTLRSDSQVLISLVIHGLWRTVARQVKAHVC